jgi:hypothetical protein
MKRKNGRGLAVSLLVLMLTASAALANTLEVAGASVTATNHLLVFFWDADKEQLLQTPTNDPAVDVTAITQQQIAGPVVRWRTRGEQFDLEYIAGVNPLGHLLVFSWSRQAASAEDWHFVNVSSFFAEQNCILIPSAGPSGKPISPTAVSTLRSDDCSVRIAGPLTYWQTPDGPFLVDHLAGVTPKGNLQVFFLSTQSNPEQGWQAVNVSALTQQRAFGPLTSWQAQEGRFNVEHVATASPDGDLVVFSWNPATDWQVLNVSNQIELKTGTRPEITGPLTSWQSAGLLGLGAIAHVAGTSPSGDLLVVFHNPVLEDLVFGRPPTWQFVNVSERTQQKIKACTRDAEPPCGVMDSWMAKSGDELTTAVVQGDLIAVFYSLAVDQDTRWGVCDIDLKACSNPR